MCSRPVTADPAHPDDLRARADDPRAHPDEGEPSLEALGDEICELAAHIAAATCRFLVLLAEWDRREGWAEWGVCSCAHWLSWRCSFGLQAAREHVRVARRLTELPLVREAFARGVLSYSKVRALTRVAAPETEEQLLMLAEHATGAQLDKIVGGYASALAATAEAAVRAHDERRLHCDWEDDGSLSIRGRLPAEEGALLLAALEGAAGSSESLPERRADALATLARGALAAPEAKRAGGDPCQIVVHVDSRTLSEAGDGIVERCELEDGPSLAPDSARRLACDAALVAIVERDGRPLSVGRRTRTIPPSLRRALRSRDAGCRFPGCTHRRFLHAHHIDHWAHGGETSLGNLVQLCSHHHRLVHEGGFRVERRAATLCFRRPDGRVIPASVPARPARGPRPAGRRPGARRIDANTCRPRSAGAPLDYGIAVGGLIERVEAAHGPPG